MASDVSALHEYLQMALDMESNLYAQEKLLDELKTKHRGIKMLALPGRPADAAAPQAPKAPTMPVKPTMPKSPLKSGISGIIILILGFLFALASAEMYAHRVYDHLEFLLGICSFVMVPYGLISTIAFPAKIIKNKRDLEKRTLDYEKAKADCERASEKARMDYEKAKSDYEENKRAALHAWQEKVKETEAENSRRRVEQAVLQANMDAVDSQLASSRKMRSKIYSAGIIHPKYRSLIAVSSLCEYLDTGRCAQLEGPDGAYNLFENEVRLDRICLQMDTVIKQLNTLNQSQYRLYTAVTDGFKRNERLLRGIADDLQYASCNLQYMAGDLQYIAASEQENAARLSAIGEDLSSIQTIGGKIEANSQLIAYNTERTQKELEYYNRMRHRLGDYDKVWDNYRP